MAPDARGSARKSASPPESLTIAKNESPPQRHGAERKPDFRMPSVLPSALIGENLRQFPILAILAILAIL
jgi:hypothetical protein